IAPGVYSVDDNGTQRIVYVAGPEGDRWAWCDGRLYRDRGEDDAPSRRRPAKAGRYVLTAPMPATVVKIFVTPGQAVRHGDTLVLVEAMKMELPIRAPADGTVKAVNCHAGELVQPDRT